MTPHSAPRHIDPYLAGVELGLVLLTCYALTGRGLGASGAFANLATAAVAMAAPGVAANNSYFQGYLQTGSPWTAWLTVEIAGLIAGAALSATLGRKTVGRPVREPAKAGRMIAASGGGVLMGIGAVLARGCTSGLALSGGALLGVGSWIFMIALFASGFAAAPLIRRLWA